LVRNPVDSQPPSYRKEDYQPGCRKEERRIRRPASRYDDSSDIIQQARPTPDKRHFQGLEITYVLRRRRVIITAVNSSG
jgi:hypothetical protein